MQQPAIFDKIAYQYDENRGGEERGKRFAKNIIPFLMKGERVLEIGVGTGVVASAIEDSDFNVIGIDVSKEMLKRTTGRVRQVVWADMNRLPFIDGYFGSVYAVYALHLANDVPEMLKEVRRVLIASGRFMNISAVNRQLVPINDDAEKIIWEMHAALAGPELTVDAPHQLQEYARAADFEFEQTVDISHEYETTPSMLALHLERRGMSILQKATEEQVRNIINPTIEALRALPDVTLHRRRIHQISVLKAL
jgi:ubiquinone/menaquinone biosynthesis C-methylase UbiE